MAFSIIRFGWLNFKRRGTSTVLIIIGLLISTSVITGSLIVGDSMVYFVEESTYNNLGEIDIAVTSPAFFNYSLFTALKNDPEILNVIDKIAPAILIGTAVRNEEVNLIDLKCSLIGIDSDFYEFGAFIRPDGNNLQPTLISTEVILNTQAATNLDAQLGDRLKLTFRNPQGSLDSIYVDFDKPRTLELNLVVKSIVKDNALGNFQLEGRNEKNSNIFINLEYLQSVMGIGSKINTVIISNKGDERSGVELDSEVVHACEVALDSEIGYSEIGLKLEHAESYLMLTSTEIFYDYTYFKLLNELQTNLEAGNDVRQVSVSPVLTYFVNSITKYDGTRVGYSTITGFDPELDAGFGEFIGTESHNTLAGTLEANEISLNNWTAEQLQVTEGDVITINYTVIDRLFNLETAELELTVKHIVNIEGKADDRNLMPEFPGLQGIDSCFNWDPPFPLDLETLEDADVDYWMQYRGTPKCFISLNTARAIWGNGLGELTLIKILPLGTGTFNEYELLIGTYLDENIGYTDMGLTITTVKSDSLETARGMSIFPMMFLAFGMIIILAGIILIINIFITQAEERRYEFGLVRALGFKRVHLLKIMLVEGLIYATLSSVIGVLVGLFIGFILVTGLNSIWSATVGGNLIPFYFNTVSLILAFLAGFIITLITIMLISVRIGRLNIVQAMQTVSTDSMPKALLRSKLKKLKVWYLLLSTIGILITIYPLVSFIRGSSLSAGEFISLLIGPNIVIMGVLGSLSLVGLKKDLTRARISQRNRYFITAAGGLILIHTILFDLINFNRSDVPFLELYFISGLLLVFSTVLITVCNLDIIAKSLNLILSTLKRSSSPPNSLFKLATLYPVRSLKRTGMTIVLFALVLFIIAAMGVNIAIQTANINVQATGSGGGGYDIIGESNVPVKFDLNNQAELANNNISSSTLTSVEVTAIKMVGDEGGTCSNMNVRYPPRILGVDPDFIAGNQFGFIASKWERSDSNEVWSKLNAPRPNNRIPIIVEYNTLVWIYEEELGSIFKLKVESGVEHELEVIAITDTSIFAGTFIMSEENLDNLFPKAADYHLFLFKVKNDGDIEQIALNLELELSTLGMDTVTIQARLLDNIRYEQSFMVLFQVFLGLGLIIGIVGLGVITARSTQERRWEIGVLRAIGFKRKMILKLFLMEIIFVVVIGIIIGIFLGILSSYLSFNLWQGASYQYVVPWKSLLFLGGIVLAVTILCTLYPAYKASRITPIEALRYLE